MSLTTMTSQGFINRILSNGDWAELILAQYQDACSQLSEIKFTNLSKQLQVAFQCNQQFLVITNNQYLGQLTSLLTPNQQIPDTAFYNLVELADWQMALNVGTQKQGDDYDNVLIFKFCEGSIKDWVKVPQQWTQAKNFNLAGNNANESELLNISQWLQKYIEEAESQYDNFQNPYFEYFVNAVSSEDWQGVLALKLDVTQFPPTLQNPFNQDSQFYAHHFGIEMNSAPTTRSLKPDTLSSLFGLVYYIDPVYENQLNAPQSVPQTNGRLGSSKPLVLKALFKNSVLIQFYCFPAAT